MDPRSKTVPPKFVPSSGTQRSAKAEPASLDSVRRSAKAKPESADRSGTSAGDHPAPASSPPTAEVPAALLTAYSVEETLGAGAMGVVVRAVQIGLDRAVAIKLPTLDDAAAVARFVREGRLLAGLAHPNLVRVFDAGEAEGRPYIVLEFVKGCTLTALAGGRALPVDVASALTVQLLDGLAHAHARGILHRDVKPDNALVTSDGLLKLADFGLARSESETSQTRVGTIMGTPAYMSPEQATGERVDARSDVYSAGVVLYELLSGRQPFVSESLGEMLQMQMHQPPPPLAVLAPATPTPLLMVVDRALAKAAGDRFETAEAFAEAVREAVGERTVERGAAKLAGLVELAGSGAQVVAGTGLFAKTGMSAPGSPRATRARSRSSASMRRPVTSSLSLASASVAKSPGDSRTVRAAVAVGTLAALLTGGIAFVIVQPGEVVPAGEGVSGAAGTGASTSSAATSGAATAAGGDALLLDLCDARAERRAAAARALGARDLTTAETAALVESLDDVEATVRTASARALGRASAAVTKPADSSETSGATVASLLVPPAQMRGRDARATSKTVGLLPESRTSATTEVVSELVDAQLDGSPDVRREAIESLCRMGEAAEPALDALLEESDEYRRVIAARALTRVEWSSTRTLDLLLAMLNFGEECVRMEAAAALGHGTADPARRMRVLADLVDRGGTDERWIAGMALGRFGREASRVLPKLGAGAYDSIAPGWAWTLGQVAPEQFAGTSAKLSAEELARTIERHLERADPRNGGLLSVALSALGRVRATSPSQLARMAGYLNHPISELRHCAAAAMAECAPASVAILEAKLRKGAARERAAAAWALGLAGERAAAAVPALIAATRDPIWRVRVETIRALGRIGPAAHAAAARLVEVTSDRDPDYFTGPTASLAWQRLGSGATSVALNGLSSNSAVTRQYWLSYLAHNGRPRDRVVESLLLALKHDDHAPNRSAAGGALLNRRLATRPVMRALADAARGDADATVRNAAAGVFGHLFPRRVPALIQLLSRAEGGPGAVTDAAVDIVESTGVEWLGDLEKSCVDPRSEVRAAARCALVAAARWDPTLIRRFETMAPEPDPARRALACDLIGLLGPAALASEPVIRRLLEDPDPGVRENANSFLPTCGSQSAEGLGAIRRALASGSEGVRRGALGLLCVPRVADKGLLDALRHEIGKADTACRYVAIRALGILGRNDDDSVKLLVKHLQAPKDDGERSEILWALRECPFLEFAMKQMPSPETTRALRDLGEAE